MEKFNFGRRTFMSILDGNNNVEPPIRNNNIVRQIQPLMSNRFLINVNGVDIPERLFLEYSLIFTDNVFKLTVTFYDTVEHWFNPNDINDITGFTIRYLDPIGETISTLNIIVINPLTFERSGSYSNGDIIRNHLSFNVNVMQY